jgi:hypothetical protein
MIIAVSPQLPLEKMSRGPVMYFKIYILSEKNTYKNQNNGPGGSTKDALIWIRYQVRYGYGTVRGYNIS